MSSCVVQTHSCTSVPNVGSDLFRTLPVRDLFGAPTTNKCPDCGFFAARIDQWLKWDGRISKRAGQEDCIVCFEKGKLAIALLWGASACAVP
jgi:hypothetical protein